MCSAAEETVRKGGKVLIPIGGVGKAQEIAALLDDHWCRYDVQAPILLNTGLIDAGMEILKGLEPSWSRVRWDGMQFVSKADVPTVLKQYAAHPVVYLTPPKTLDTGASLEIFKEWAGDPKNLILLPSYSFPGTVAYQVLNGLRPIKLPQRGAASATPQALLASVANSTTTATNPNNILELKAPFRYFSLGSHSDLVGIVSFLKYAAPLMSVLVHGEIMGMTHLSSNLRKLLRRPVLCPKNNESIVVQLPGIRAQPKFVQELFYEYCRSSSEVIRRKKGGGADSFGMSLKDLLKQNLKEADRRMRNVTKRASRNSNSSNSSPVSANTVKRPNAASVLTNLDEQVVKDWCPSILPLLDSRVEFNGGRRFCNNGGAVSTSIFDILKKEEPWSIEELRDGQQVQKAASNEMKPPPRAVKKAITKSVVNRSVRDRKQKGKNKTAVTTVEAKADNVEGKIWQHAPLPTQRHAVSSATTYELLFDNAKVEELSSEPEEGELES